MNTKLSQIPFVRLFLPFAAGISLALHYEGKFIFVYITFALFLILLGWKWYENKYNVNYNKRWVSGVLIAAFLISAGYSFTLLNTSTERHTDISNHLQNEPHSFLVSIVSTPQEKEKTVKAVAEVIGIVRKGYIEKTGGKALLYFMKDSVGDTIRYGDVLRVHTKFLPVKPPLNPDEFDYKHYLELHGIHYEGFVPKHSFSFTGKTDTPFLLRLTHKWREKLIRLINERIGGNEAAVGSAILLGYREDLTPAVIQQFADSGTVHVICVAGLHVGIFFWVLNFIFLFFDKIKHGKLIRTILLLLLLWMYALLTGMATPVMRATVMFSFLLAGKHFGRYTNSVNTLAASAFFMLFINPFTLADTGFQLSYFAVLGILAIYPALNNLLEPRYFITEKIWELACLSASAQLAIAPLSLLYFHQFPNYFIFTNILVVPLLSVVIYSGILFLITAHISFISSVTTWVFQKSLLLMNFIVGHFNRLPLYVTRGISISTGETMLLYVCLIALCIFFATKKYRVLILSLSCLTLFMGMRVWRNITNSRQQVFMVYHISKRPAIAFISGRQSLLAFSNIDSSNFTYHVQYHFWEKGIRDTMSLNKDTSAIFLSGHLFVQHNFVQFNEKRYAFIRTNDDVPDSLQKVSVHCLVISKDYKLGMAALQNAFTFDSIIFDSSIAPARLKKWKNECEELHIPYYDVGKQGAYIENS